MTSHLTMFDVVALLVNDRANGLIRGQVGTIVEQLDNGWFEVDFCDDAGRSYAQAAFSAHALLRLSYRRREHAL